MAIILNFYIIANKVIYTIIMRKLQYD